MGATTRPPTFVCSFQAFGIRGAPAVAITQSYGAFAGYPIEPSPTTTSTRYPYAVRFARAVFASSGIRSTDTTRSGPTSSASKAALYPQPAPISRTCSPGFNSASSSMIAIIEGAEIV